MQISDQLSVSYGGLNGCAMRQYLSNNIYATIDNIHATVNNNYAMIDDYLYNNGDTMIDNNHTTIMMRQLSDR